MHRHAISSDLYNLRKSSYSADPRQRGAGRWQLLVTPTGEIW